MSCNDTDDSGLSFIKHMQLIALEAEFAGGALDGDFVVAAPAGGAVMLLGHLHAGEHAIQR